MSTRARALELDTNVRLIRITDKTGFACCEYCVTYILLCTPLRSVLVFSVYVLQFMLGGRRRRPSVRLPCDCPRCAALRLLPPTRAATARHLHQCTCAAWSLLDLACIWRSFRSVTMHRCVGALHTRNKLSMYLLTSLCYSLLMHLFQKQLFAPRLPSDRWFHVKCLPH